MSSDSRPLIIACGALVSELRSVLVATGIEDSVEVKYLPANLHNRPENIAPQVEEILASSSRRRVFVAYADCGTGGHLDLVLAKYPKVERLPGAHCYEFFAGTNEFMSAHDEEPGTFYLTDFLAKHFDALVWQGLGLDEHPELRETYFGNYRRVLLLSQTNNVEIVSAGRLAAQKLGLEFEHRHVGLENFTNSVPVAFLRPTDK
ncbi:MAG: DUF1638 domain-containing protein [Actinobacteria bacterium]|nr:DUF1638 domain-containing protein [Actinomycetota bacterium]NBQ44848.1 DUF1638 domain-containing protein [Actinomycetota bacterium]NDB42096.1 DUF1638 domain-containing protein [Actinomycetota bacterium]NDE70217.1 DUF1638 domain-containing protein [Actinomycetota bacterium]HBQ51354.1 hypothetical protein [Acidimicrobium sp.]